MKLSLSLIEVTLYNILTAQLYMSTNVSTQIQQLERQLRESFLIQNPDQTENSSARQSTDSKNINIVSKMQSIMKIFINSLKLNQKLYNSITETQSKIQSQTNAFFDVTSETDTKMQDAVKRTKELYEDTVHQNQKARFLLEQFISPIRQELRSKVDETTFSLQMRMLLDEYDVMGQRITYEKTDEQKKVKDQKQKSVSSQTLIFLRDHILPVISHVEHKLQESLNKSSLVSNRMDDYDTQKKYLQSELNVQRQTIQQIEKKNIKRINQKVSDQVIERKIKQTIKVLMTQYSQDVSVEIEKTNRFSKGLENNFISQIQQTKQAVSSFLSNQKASDTYFKTQIQKQSKQLEQQKNTIKKHTIQIERILERLPQYDKNVQFVSNFYQKFDGLNQKVQKGDFQSKQGFKGQEFQIMMKRLNDFQLQSKKIKKSHRQAEERALIFKGQMQGVRDILSKKANFSDILMHIENKVDKQEFKELKLLIEEMKASKIERKSSSAGLNEFQQSLSSRKKHLRNRSFFSPSPIQKHSSQDQDPTQVKRFKLGINTEFFYPPDGAKYSKTHNLRQSIVNNNNSNLAKEIPQD